MTTRSFLTRALAVLAAVELIVGVAAVDAVARRTRTVAAPPLHLAAAGASSEAFLLFHNPSTAPQVSGETVDAKRFAPNAVGIDAFSLGLKHPVTVGSASTGGGAGAGRTALETLSVTKTIDAASASLFKAAATGARFTSIELFVRRMNGAGNGAVYLRYEFRDAIVSGITWKSSTGGAPVESIDFEYGALTISYTPMKADGTPGTKNTGGWNQVTNSQVPAS